MKIKLLLISLLIYSLTGQSQSLNELSISDCYKLAEENYPLVKQRQLLDQSKEYSIENASKGYYPQVTLNGQATYQSDVVQIPFSAPGMEVEPLSKDQYKIYGEVNQTLLDGGGIRQQKKLQDVIGRVEEQKLEVELYKIRERINQLFFGALLLQEQIKQGLLLKQDLEIGIKKTEASIANGIALKSSADILRAELLKVQQRIIEMNSGKKAFLDMLGFFIGKEISENVEIETPESPVVQENIQRPELALFQIQKEVFDVQERLTNTRHFPKLGAFFQGGYGRPALNMLKNEFDYYYIAGVRFNWSLSGFYSDKKEKEIFQVNKSLVEAQKETFLFNTKLNLKQQSSEVRKLEELIEVDKEIITIRNRIKALAMSQLENGVITSNDYLREVNAEDFAKLSLLIHQVQLLSAKYALQTITGEN